MSPTSLSAPFSSGSAAEISDLAALITHSIDVEENTSLDATYELLRQTGVEFLGVVQNRHFRGIVSRAQIAELLSGRFGHAVFSRKPVGDHLLRNSVSVSTGTPLLDVLEKVFSRTGEAFHYDIALTNTDGAFLGLISLHTLVRVQSALINEQVRTLQEQQRILEERNQALFRSAAELRQSEGRFEILFENAALGVALLSAQGRLELANRRLRTLLGPGVSEQNFLELISPEQRLAFAQLFTQHKCGTEAPASGRDFLFNLPNRGWRVLRFSTSWIEETGQICAFVDDVTEQRELERKVLQQEKTALLDSLVGGIAHELNNKLLPVMGYADLLALESSGFPQNEDFQQGCEIIKQSAQECADIVKQLQQLSRPVTMEVGPLDLRNVIEDALAVLRFRIRDSQSELELRIPEGPVPVLGNRAQLKQVVVNLAINAMDAMESSATPCLTLGIEIADDKAILLVQDTGDGIPPEHHDRIFDPFFSTKGPQRGTGLGLSICSSIMRQHRGEIRIANTGKEGTSFIITLPLEQTIAATTPDGQLPLPANKKAPVGSGLRVLVADDEKVITRLVQEGVRRDLQGEVVQVHSAEAALEELETQNFDLVISDIRMPGIGGLGLLEKMRERWPGLAQKLLLISGDPGSADLHRRLYNEGVPILRKPFPLDALLTRCREILSISRDVPAEREQFRVRQTTPSGTP